MVSSSSHLKNRLDLLSSFHCLHLVMNSLVTCFACMEARFPSQPAWSNHLPHSHFSTTYHHLLLLLLLLLLDLSNL
ncbi:hypothetical protein VIGAN_11238100 [Vigna angularis var. angularis]|uniref:Uncharacterized protein n=1 Tax=Vigna angularis var. angularis TaxID=157739 RepID=A0A0S3TCA8_PHAAN|nr:hypothetical protein VIGAN_11238100 [Vigna angularis var. angularis]